MLLDACICQTHRPRAGCGARLIFKKITAGLNLEFCFSIYVQLLVAMLRHKKPACPTTLVIGEGEKIDSYLS